MTIAASGMQACLRSFTAHAANIVNAQSTVQAPATAANVYQPTSIVQGLIPGGDTATEMVGALQAANDFRASLAAFRAGDRMFKTLLDTVA